MNLNVIEMMFALLRSAVCGNLLLDDEKANYSEEILMQIREIAKKHDIQPMIAFALKCNSLYSKHSKEFEKDIFATAFRYEQMNLELAKLCDALEAAKIPFIPLKGSVIRDYYPEPWMRTSCDIDVLVCECDLQKATDYLIENLGYKFNHKFTHDVSMFTPNGKHIELHYNLMEDEPIKSSYSVLNDVWSTASKCNGYEYWYELPDEVFYFYHIAHMAKHFENGGCGIRAFIDIYVLNHNMPFDSWKRMKLLEKGDLVIFAQQAELLSEIWFGSANHTMITRQMEHFIIQGGVYGITENYISVQQQKKGGKIGFAISKIWIPYDMLKYYYPILEKHKWLMPIMEVSRWCRLGFGGQFKRVTKELKYNSGISKKTANETKNFLENIGLG